MLVRLGSRNWCEVKEDPDDDGLLEISLRVGSAAPVIFKFEDAFRPMASAVIEKLKTSGLMVEVLSGDRDAAVSRAARESGVDRYFGRKSPQAKLQHIEELDRLGHKVLVVGDGINDAPSLAAGFASMAPASASDIGRTAADVVFMGRSLEPVTQVRQVALAAQSVARQNVALAIGYNLLAVPIAILGFATPLIAAVAMSSSSIIVIANALRLGWCTRHPFTAEDQPVIEPVADETPHLRFAA